MASTSTLKQIIEEVSRRTGLALPLTVTATTTAITGSGNNELKGPFTTSRFPTGAPIKVLAGGTVGENTYVYSYTPSTGIITCSPAITTGATMIRSTMQRVPLSLNQILERAGRLFPGSEIVSRLPDKSLARHRFSDFYARARRLASGLKSLGLEKGDRVATLSWNHYAHLESYFGIPAAGGVMHTLNLRLAPAEIA